MMFRCCFTALSASILVIGCSPSNDTVQTPVSGASITSSGSSDTGGLGTTGGGLGTTGGGLGTTGASTQTGMGGPGATGVSGAASTTMGGSTGSVSGSTSGMGGTGGNDMGTTGDVGQGGAATTGGNLGGSGGVGGTGFDPGDFFGVEEGDTIPHRQLNFTFDGGRDIVQFRPSEANPAAAGGPTGTDEIQRAGVNSCANKMLGKLLVNLDVSVGNYWDWAAQRGFHVFGVDFYRCESIDRFWEKRDRDYPGDCRLETLDGQDHDSEVAIDLAHSITGHLQDGLRYLHERNPSQDWEYFLNEDGSIRWSDIAFTGESHGAQSAMRFAKAVRLFRAVSRSGPRDNGCGSGASNTTFDPNNPPWDDNCPMERISSWLDEESATPIGRMFGLTGAQDSQFGDIMFSMQRMDFVGEFVNLENAQPPFNSNRFYSTNYGHGTFQEDRFTDALNYAFGVPEENWNGCD